MTSLGWGAAARAMTAARALTTAVALVAGGCMAPGAEVPYVQTPDNVVREMLKLAGVGPADVVYDLGSGDGRVVLMAAREFGARGVGIEIDPDLVAQSREQARRLGLAERVRFEHRDIFETDVSPATVVTLYLSVELNRRLQPKLLRELRPGSRIVSHDFPIGDWRPDRTITVESRDRSHALSLWIVPPRS